MENYGILLVDGEAAYRPIVAAMLFPFGVTVDGVHDIAAALPAIRARRYDLILADPGLRGETASHGVAAMRAAAPWAGLAPIIAFTGGPPPDGVRHFIDRGFDGLLAKPFGTDDLLPVLRRWLDPDGFTAAEDGSVERLGQLLGAEAAGSMIERLRASLADAVAAIDAGVEAQAYGHRLGGLAGTLGFGVLSAAWLTLQDGDVTAWPTVRRLTREALARHGRGVKSAAD